MNIKKFKNDFWDKPIEEITHKEIAAWQKREQEKYTGAYLNKNLSSLQVMLDWAADPLINYINTNPLKGIKRLPENDSKEYSVNLTEKRYSEFIEFLRKRDEERKDFWLPAVILATNTGLRRSTLFGIKWKDIDWSERRISLDPAIMKVKRKKHSSYAE